MHALVSVGARLPRRRQWVGALRRLLTAGGGATAGNDFKSLAEHQRSHWTFMIGCLHLSSLTPPSSRSLEENSLSVKTRREGASLEAADVERAGAARPNRCNKHLLGLARAVWWQRPIGCGRKACSFMSFGGIRIVKLRSVNQKGAQACRPSARCPAASDRPPY